MGRLGESTCELARQWLATIDEDHRNIASTATHAAQADATEVDLKVPDNTSFDAVIVAIGGDTEASIEYHHLTGTGRGS